MSRLWNHSRINGWIYKLLAITIIKKQIVKIFQSFERRLSLLHFHDIILRNNISVKNELRMSVRFIVQQFKYRQLFETLKIWRKFVVRRCVLLRYQINEFDLYA